MKGRRGAMKPSKLKRICLGTIALALAGIVAALALRTWAQDTPLGDAIYAQVAAKQWAEYQADIAKTIIELQPFRRTTVLEIGEPGGRRGTAALIELNPRINAWLLLTLKWAGSAQAESYHIENPQPQVQSVALNRDGVTIQVEDRSIDCSLWPSALEQARRSGLPYAPLCEDRLYLRNAVAGTYTRLERITNLLRDHVWGGDRIVGFVREQLLRDTFVERGQVGIPARPLPSPTSGPRPASIADEVAGSAVHPEHLGIDVGQSSGDLLLGQWYPVRNTPGIFVSVLQPRAIEAVILNGDRSVVNALDAVEATALDFLVALDLSRFDLGFALGTDHPRVGWSPRALDQVRNPRLPGPDGIGTVAPLVVNGMVSPPLVQHTAATFTAGFKREHGAFRYGSFATQNSGTHYGFVEQGVVFSKLQPGLATIFVTDEGAVHMGTWTRDDEGLLSHVRYARQNGVPLIEYDARIGSTPGSLVNRWGPGNWSGSSEAQLRTLRAGACLQETGSARFLIYGYFSTATPSAMARVFQAYGCSYAMQLDINALEHTYFAIYTREHERIAVQHLIEGMAVIDRKGGGELSPRFLAFPDDRDFFYLTRKERSP